MIDQLAIARHLVWLAAQGEEPAHLTPLHLQKLLYYAQQWHLAIFAAPLMSSQFVAWKLGPVDPAIYHEFKNLGGNPIPFDQGVPAYELQASRELLLRRLWEHYRKWSAFGLSDKAHGEKPWLAARDDLPRDAHCDNPIDPKLMIDDFRREFGLDDRQIEVMRLGYETEDRPSGPLHRYDRASGQLVAVA